MVHIPDLPPSQDRKKHFTRFQENWPHFLGWALSLLIICEIILRIIFAPFFFPHYLEKLPTGIVQEILPLLLGLIGLG